MAYLQYRYLAAAGGDRKKDYIDGLGHLSSVSCSGRRKDDASLATYAAGGGMMLAWRISSVPYLESAVIRWGFVAYLSSVPTS